MFDRWRFVGFALLPVGLTASLASIDRRLAMVTVGGGSRTDLDTATGFVTALWEGAPRSLDQRQQFGPAQRAARRVAALLSGRK